MTPLKIFLALFTLILLQGAMHADAVYELAQLKEAIEKGRVSHGDKVKFRGFVYRDGLECGLAETPTLRSCCKDKIHYFPCVGLDELPGTILTLEGRLFSKDNGLWKVTETHIIQRPKQDRGASFLYVLFFLSALGALLAYKYKGSLEKNFQSTEQIQKDSLPL